MRTEFRGRALKKEDIEASKKEYDDLIEVCPYSAGLFVRRDRETVDA